MCGRFALAATPEELANHFNLKRKVNIASARYNIAPSQPVVIVRPGAYGYALSAVRWGLIPPWSKDEKKGYKLITPPLNQMNPGVASMLRSSRQASSCWQRSWSTSSMGAPVFLALASVSIRVCAMPRKRSLWSRSSSFVSMSIELEEVDGDIFQNDPLQSGQVEKTVIKCQLNRGQKGVVRIGTLQVQQALESAAAFAG